MIDYDKIATIWNESATLADAAKRLHKSPAALQQQCAKMRRRGYKMKNFPRGRPQIPEPKQ